MLLFINDVSHVTCDKNSKLQNIVALRLNSLLLKDYTSNLISRLITKSLLL